MRTKTGTFPIVERKIFQLLQRRLRNLGAQKVVELWPTRPELFCLCSRRAKLGGVPRSVDVQRAPGHAPMFWPLNARGPKVFGGTKRFPARSPARNRRGHPAAENRRPQHDPNPRGGAREQYQKGKPQSLVASGWEILGKPRSRTFVQKSRELKNRSFFRWDIPTGNHLWSQPYIQVFFLALFNSPTFVGTRSSFFLIKIKTYNQTQFFLCFHMHIRGQILFLDFWSKRKRRFFSLESFFYFLSAHI